MTQTAKLDNYSILELKGVDAQTFLQGQISQDLKTLNLGDGKWFGLSNAKGRLLAVGQVYLADENTYWLVLPKAIAENILPYLLRYKFRSKVAFALRDDLHVYGAWNSTAIDAEHKIKLLDASNCHVLISTDEIESNATEADWTEQKILNGLPDVFIETQEKFVAQMLNLDLIDGVSFSKGCYTGQEIIARMQHLGRIKRRMLAFEVDDALTIGDKFEIDGESLGQVVNFVETDDMKLALVCVQLDKYSSISTEKEKRLNIPYEK